MMFLTKPIRALCLVMCAAFQHVTSEAGVISFTNRDDWLAALPGIASPPDTFEDLNDSFYISPLRRQGYTVSAANGLYSGRSSSRVLSTNSPEPLTLRKSNPILAIGLSVGLTDIDFKPLTGSMDFELANEVITRNTSGLVFMGFISSTPFTSLKISPLIVSSALYPTIDNVEFYPDSGVAPVPEPATFTLFSAAGLALLARSRLQRFKRKSASSNSNPTGNLEVTPT
jgi:hypothetical protein